MGKILQAERSAEGPRESPGPASGGERGFGAIEHHLLRHVDLLATSCSTGRRDTSEQRSGVRVRDDQLIMRRGCVRGEKTRREKRRDGALGYGLWKMAHPQT